VISDFGKRYLDLRCEGYPLQRRNETADAPAGESFRANSRRNNEATIALFVELCGDLPTADIQEHHCKEFVSFLSQIPASHGKSAKERRGIRQVVLEADREEERKIEDLRVRMRRAGNSPGEIEDAVAAERKPRLRTETCVRHMRFISQLMEFAIFDGVRSDNPMKDLVWTSKEIKSRTAREKTAKRAGWGDDVDKLLASPIYHEPLDEPGEPLFWAPLLALFAGLRMEEALQLRVDDFASAFGVAYINVWVGDEHQRLKSESGQRQVPLHRTLLDLGLLQLVELRRSAGRGRIFTYLERGKNKGKLGEIFSKRFTHYRRRHNIYKAVQDFHGLRTEFNTRLTHALVQENFCKYLMGHEITDVTHVNYFRAVHPMPTLKKCADVIDIDCSRVRRPFPAAPSAEGQRLLRIVATEPEHRPMSR
jgi:integrase